MGFEFYQEYEFVQPEYRSVIHELRDGDQCKFAGNSDPLRGIIASNSDPF